MHPLFRVFRGCEVKGSTQNVENQDGCLVWYQQTLVFCSPQPNTGTETQFQGYFEGPGTGLSLPPNWERSRAEIWEVSQIDWQDPLKPTLSLDFMSTPLNKGFGQELNNVRAALRSPAKSVIFSGLNTETTTTKNH